MPPSRGPPLSPPTMTRRPSGVRTRRRRRRGRLPVAARHADEGPGNVRELEEVIARLALARRSGTVGVDDLPTGHREHARRRLTALEALERDAIVRELVARGGSKDAAARALGISRATLYRRLDAYGIEWPVEAYAHPGSARGG